MNVVRRLKRITIESGGEEGRRRRQKIGLDAIRRQRVASEDEKKARRKEGKSSRGGKMRRKEKKRSKEKRRNRRKIEEYGQGSKI